MLRDSPSMHPPTLQVRLTFAVLGASVLAVSSFGPSPPKPRVVVVGAGFAGLGAATTLEAKG